MTCKNCQNELYSPYLFCSNCGAKHIQKRLTLKNFSLQVTETFLNVDNTLFKTFIHMFTKPEQVVDGFISGIRKRYLNPFNYMAVAITLSGLQLFIIKKFRPNFYTSFNVGDQNTEIFRQSVDTFLDYQAIFSFLTIPFMAVISLIVFFNYRKYNFTEQAVIYMYSYTQISIVLSFFIISILPFYASAPLWVNLVTYISLIGYHAYVLKRVFTLSYKQIFLKTLLFLGIFLTFYIIIVFVVVILFFVFVGFPKPS